MMLYEDCSIWIFKAYKTIDSSRIAFVKETQDVEESNRGNDFE